LAHIISELVKLLLPPVGHWNDPYILGVMHTDQPVHSLYSSPNVSRIKGERVTAIMGKVRSAYRMLVTRLEVRGHLEGMADSRTTIR
jgi:hypothetical protein